MLVDGMPVTDCVVEIAWRSDADWLDLLFVPGALSDVAECGSLAKVRVEGHVETECAWYDFCFLGETDGNRHIWCPRAAGLMERDLSAGRLREAVRAVREGRR